MKAYYLTPEQRKQLERKDARHCTGLDILNRGLCEVVDENSHHYKNKAFPFQFASSSGLSSWSGEDVVTKYSKSAEGKENPTWFMDPFITLAQINLGEVKLYWVWSFMSCGKQSGLAGVTFLARTVAEILLISQQCLCEMSLTPGSATFKFHRI